MKALLVSSIALLILATLANTQNIGNQNTVRVEILLPVATYDWASKNSNIYAERIHSALKLYLIHLLETRIGVDLSKLQEGKAPDEAIIALIGKSVSLQLQRSGLDAASMKTFRLLPETATVSIKLDAVNSVWNTDEKYNYANCVLILMRRKINEFLTQIFPSGISTETKVTAINFPQFDLQWVQQNKALAFERLFSIIWNSISTYLEQQTMITLNGILNTAVEVQASDAIKNHVNIKYKYGGSKLAAGVSFDFFLDDVKAWDVKRKLNYIYSIIFIIKTSLNNMIELATNDNSNLVITKIQNKDLDWIKANSAAYRVIIYDAIWGSLSAKLQAKLGINILEALNKATDPTKEFAELVKSAITFTFVYEKNYQSGKVPTGVEVVVNWDFVKSNWNDQQKAHFAEAIVIYIQNTAQILIKAIITGNTVGGNIAEIKVEFPVVQYQWAIDNKNIYYQRLQNILWETTWKSLQQRFDVSLADIEASTVDQQIVNAIEAKLDLNVIFNRDNIPIGANIHSNYLIELINTILSKQEIVRRLRTYRFVLEKVLTSTLNEVVGVDGKDTEFTITINKVDLNWAMQNYEEYSEQLQKQYWSNSVKQYETVYNINIADLSSAEIDAKILSELENTVTVRLNYERGDTKIPIGIKVDAPQIDITRMTRQQILSYVKSLQLVIGQKLRSRVIRSVLGANFQIPAKVVAPQVSFEWIESNTDAYIELMQISSWGSISRELQATLNIDAAGMTNIGSITLNQNMVQELSKLIEVTLHYSNNNKKVPSNVIVKTNFNIAATLSLAERLSFARAAQEALYGKMRQVVKVNVEANIDYTAPVGIKFPKVDAAWAIANQAQYITQLQTAYWQSASTVYAKKFNIDVSKIATAVVSNELSKFLESKITLTFTYEGNERKVPSGINIVNIDTTDYNKLTEEMKAAYLRTMQYVIDLKMKAQIAKSISGSEEQVKITLKQIEASWAEANFEEYVREMSTIALSSAARDLEMQLGVKIEEAASATVNANLLLQMLNTVKIRFQYTGANKKIPSGITILRSDNLDVSKMSKQEILQYIKTVQTFITKTIEEKAYYSLNGIKPNLKIQFRKVELQWALSNEAEYLNTLMSLFWSSISYDLSQDFEINVSEIEGVKENSELASKLDAAIVILLRYEGTDRRIPIGMAIRSSYNTDNRLSWTKEEKLTYLATYRLVIRRKLREMLIRSINIGEPSERYEIQFPKVDLAWAKANMEEYVLKMKQDIFIFNAAQMAAEFEVNLMQVETASLNPKMQEKYEKTLQIKLEFKGDNNEIPSGVLIEISDPYDYTVWSIKDRLQLIYNLRHTTYKKIRPLLLSAIKGENMVTSVQFKQQTLASILISFETYIASLENELWLNYAQSLATKYKIEISQVSGAKFDATLARTLESAVTLTFTLDSNKVPSGITILCNYQTKPDEMSIEEKLSYLRTLQEIVLKKLHVLVYKTFQEYVAEIHVALPEENLENVLVDSDAYAVKLETAIYQTSWEDMEKKFGISFKEYSEEAPIVDITYAASIQNAVQLNYKYKNGLPSNLRVNFNWNLVRSDWSREQKCKFISAVRYNLARRVIALVRTVTGKISDDSIESVELDGDNDQFTRTTVVLPKVKYAWVKSNKGDAIVKWRDAIWNNVIAVLEKKFGSKLDLSGATEPDEEYLELVRGIFEYSYIYERNSLYRERRLPSAFRYKINWNRIRNAQQTAEQIKLAKVLYDFITSGVKLVIDDGLEEDASEEDDSSEENEGADQYVSFINFPRADISKIQEDEYVNNLNSIVWKREWEVLAKRLQIEVSALTDDYKVDGEYAEEMMSAINMNYNYLGRNRLPVGVRFKLNIKYIQSNWNADQKLKFSAACRLNIKKNINAMVHKSVQIYKHQQSDAENSKFTLTTLQIPTATYKWVKQNRETYFDRTYNQVWRRISDILGRKFGIKISLAGINVDENYARSINDVVSLTNNFDQNRNGQIHRFPSSVQIKIDWAKINLNWKREDRIKFYAGIQYNVKQYLNSRITQFLEAETEYDSDELEDDSDDVAVVNINFPTYNVRSFINDRRRYSMRVIYAIWNRLAVNYGRRLGIHNLRRLPYIGNTIDKSYAASIENNLKATYGYSVLDAGTGFPRAIRLSYNWKLVNKGWNRQDKIKFINAIRFNIRKMVDGKINELIKRYQEDDLDGETIKYSRDTFNLPKTTYTAVKGNKGDYQTKCVNLLWNSIAARLRNKLGINVQQTISKIQVDPAYAASITAGLDINYNFGRTTTNRDRRFPSSARITLNWNVIKTNWNYNDKLKYAAGIKYLLDRNMQDMIDEGLDAAASQESNESGEDDESNNLIENVVLPSVSLKWGTENRKLYELRWNVIIFNTFGRTLSKKLGINTVQLMSSVGKVDTDYAATLASNLKVRYEYSGKERSFPTRVRIIVNTQNVQSDWDDKQKLKYAGAMSSLLIKNVYKMISLTIEQAAIERYQAVIDLPDVDVAYVRSLKQVYIKRTMDSVWTSISKVMGPLLKMDIAQNLNTNFNVDRAYLRTLQAGMNFNYQDNASADKMAQKVNLVMNFRVKSDWNLQLKSKFVNTLYYISKSNIEDMVERKLSGTSGNTQFVRGLNVLDLDVAMPQVGDGNIRRFPYLYVRRLTAVFWEALKNHLNNRLGFTTNLRTLDNVPTARERELMATVRVTLNTGPNKMKLELNLDRARRDWNGQQRVEYINALYNAITSRCKDITDAYLRN